MGYQEKSLKWSSIAKATVGSIMVLLLLIGVFWGVAYGNRVYQRHQRVLDARNEIRVTQYRVQTENQKAQVRIAEANGIAQAQTIINGTLTPLYLQHEAIQAQLAMAHSENHTIVYIPIGNEGIPLVGTIDTTKPEEGKE